METIEIMAVITVLIFKFEEFLTKGREAFNQFIRDIEMLILNQRI